MQVRVERRTSVMPDDDSPGHQQERPGSIMKPHPWPRPAVRDPPRRKKTRSGKSQIGIADGKPQCLEDSASGRSGQSHKSRWTPPPTGREKSPQGAARSSRVEGDQYRDQDRHKATSRCDRPTDRPEDPGLVPGLSTSRGKAAAGELAPRSGLQNGARLSPARPDIAAFGRSNHRNDQGTPSGSQ